MEEKYIPIVMLIHAVFFIGMWLLVVGILRKKANMVKELDIDTGKPIAESGWGSANVNGVNARNCIKVLEYANGYVLRMRKLFGNGKLWLPKENVELLNVRNKTFFIPKYKELKCGQNTVKLYGKLSEYII